MHKKYQLLKKKIKGFIKSEELIKRFVPLEKSFLGHTIYIHDIASFNLCLKELFQEEMYKFKADTETPYIIDCGANLGMSIIYFKQLYPKSRLVAFEADNYIFSFLEKNIASFEYQDVELINKAVWNCDDTLSFLVEGGAGGRLESASNDGVFKNVPCTSIKKYITNQKVDFLKIDIEGAEYEVLEDCKEELKNVENLFIEYHSIIDKTQNLHQILEIVQNAGFRYHMKEAFTRTHPFVDQTLNYKMDLQLNIFCYRN